MTRKALVYIEFYKNKVAKVSKEIISKALSCFDDVEIDGVVIADQKTIENAHSQLKDLCVSKLYVIQDSLFDSFQTCLYSKVLSAFLRENDFDIFLMGATESGRDLAPRMASCLSIGLTADCTDLEIGEDCTLLATRPTYGGKMMATIISKTKPNFATIRPGAFKLLKHNCTEAQFIFTEPDLNGENCLTEVLYCEEKPPKEDWTCAEVIVSGGLGLKTKENFDLIYKLADLVGGKPAASRAAVELGWAPADIQVGQTGYSVSPKLYLAFGISGAMQHMVGITNSDRIIAVNIDKTAPIMNSADTAITADAVAVLNSMIEAYSSDAKVK